MSMNGWQHGDPPRVAEVVVITQAMTDATAQMARTMEIPRGSPSYALENPAYPAEPGLWLVVPGIDCSILDAARTLRQEKAA